MTVRAVLDCTLFLQAVTSDKGPAFRCFTLAEQGRFTLLISPAILDEVQDVLTRPILQVRLPLLTPERVDAFVRKFQSVASVCPNPPRAFSLPRDPADEPYTDLAVAAQANYLVTWNERRLTYLMRQDTPEGQEFCRRFPLLTILSPPEFLQAIEQKPAQ